MVIIQAAYRQGITLVPLYDTLGRDVVQFICDQTLLSTICCEGKKVMDILNIASEMTSLKNLITMEPSFTPEQVDAAKKANIQLYTYNEVLKSGQLNLAAEAVYDPYTTINTICYTSGTTGMPKGAMLTHGAFIAIRAAVNDVLKAQQLSMTNEDAHISYLPYAHVFERGVTETFIDNSVRIGYYSGNPANLVDDISLLQPTYFVSVPRVLNRIYEKVTDGLSKKTGVASILINRGLATKLEQVRNTGVVTHPLWDSLVFNKTKALLGGKVKMIFSSSAPLSPTVIEFLKVVFSTAVIEAYGMTESTCTGTFCHQLDPTTGHVGGLVSTAEMKLKDIPEMGYTNADKDEFGNPTPRGEVCFRGPGILKGYFRAPEKFAEVVDEDGWYSTGDVALILPNGAVKIIDRAKNLFKLSQGEYVAPEKIENIYQLAPAVSQAFVFGYSTERYLIGIIVPNFEEFGFDWAKKAGKGDMTKEQLCADANFQAEVLKQCTEQGKSAGLASFEQIKGLHLTPTPFTIDNELLTPSFKLKRHVAKTVFASEIEMVYNNVGGREVNGQA